MSSSVAFRALFLCVILTLLQGSFQQELFEDAIELENADPIYGNNFYSPAEENDIPDEGTSETADTPLQQTTDNQEKPSRMQPDFYDTSVHSYVNSDGYYVGLNGIDGNTKTNIDTEEVSDNSVPYPESMEETDTTEDTTADPDQISERQNHYDNEYVEKDTKQIPNSKDKDELIDQHAELEKEDRSMAEAEEESSKKESKDEKGGVVDRPEDMEKAKEDNTSEMSLKTGGKDKKSLDKKGALDSNQEKRKEQEDSPYVHKEAKHEDQLDMEKMNDKQVKLNRNDDKMKHKGKTNVDFAYIDNAKIDKKPDIKKGNKIEFENQDHIEESKRQHKNTESLSKDTEAEEHKDAEDVSESKNKQHVEIPEHKLEPGNDIEHSNAEIKEDKPDKNLPNDPTDGKSKSKGKNIQNDEHKLEPEKMEPENINEDSLKAKKNKDHHTHAEKDSINDWLNYDKDPKQSSEDEKNQAEKSDGGRKQTALPLNMPSANKLETTYDVEHRDVEIKVDKPDESLPKDSSENKKLKKYSNEDFETFPETKDAPNEHVSESERAVAPTKNSTKESTSELPKKEDTSKEKAEDIIPLDYATLSSEENEDKESFSKSAKNHEMESFEESSKEKSKSFKKVNKGNKDGLSHKSETNKSKSKAEDDGCCQNILPSVIEENETETKRGDSQGNPLNELPNFKENQKKNKQKGALSKLPDVSSNQYKNEHPLAALPNVPTKKPKRKDDAIDEIFEQNNGEVHINLEGTNDTAHYNPVPIDNSLSINLEEDTASGKDDDVQETAQKQDALFNEEVKKIERKTGKASVADNSGSAETDPSSKQMEHFKGETSEGETKSVIDTPSKIDHVVVLRGKNEEKQPRTSEDADQSGSGETSSFQDENSTVSNVADDGSGNSGNEFPGSDDDEDDSSGAERERRQAFSAEEKINEAKAKLKHAEGASDALTNIEKEMGLDPSIAPLKTKNLTSELHNEIDKFKDIITHQDDSVKRSKFQKLEKLAEEDVKGANDVMKMIVELEVAKYFAKNRARKKLELAMRSKISKPSNQIQPAPEWTPYQGMMPNYMPQFQDQPYAVPYAPYPPPAPFAPIPPMAQVPAQPPSPPQNPLEGRFMDNSFPQSWNPPVSAYIAPQRQPQDFSPYIGTPMNSAPKNIFQNMAPVAFAPRVQAGNRPAQSNIAKAAYNDEDIKAPELKAELNDEPPKQKVEAFLPKSSPFAGLKPLSLSSFKPIHALHPAPSFSSEMKGETAPFSSLKQSSLSASSLHAFSDDVRPKNVKQFFPKSAWIPPARVNTFSDSLSHLNVNYQKPSPSFKQQAPKPASPPKAQQIGNLFRSQAKPLSMHQFHPAIPFQRPMQQQNYGSNPTYPDAPPMYPQFQIPSPMEPAIPVQQYNPPAPYYPQPPMQPAAMPYVPAPLPQPQAPQLPKQDDEKDEQGPMGMNFNDEQQQPQPQPQLAFQGPQVYPQQAINVFNAYGNPGMPVDDYTWPQPSFPQNYGYQPPLSYEQQLVNPLLNEAITKIHDTNKAAQVVQNIENRIGLAPPAVNHIIDDVESETKSEKTEFDHELKQEEEKVKNEKKMMNDVPENSNIKKKIEEEEKKLEDVRKRDEIAKVKLATIKKIEKILTVIETAKYSALKRAREHLLRLKSEKDPQIQKRSLEAFEKDLHKSEKRHLHRRNEINIWLKGSRNNINTSHFIEGNKKQKEDEREHRFKAFGEPSIPKLAIANFAAKYAKKANITLPKLISKKHKIEKPKKQKVGVILMKKLLQRMDDLYVMQSKILTQLIKEHQPARDHRKRIKEKQPTSDDREQPATDVREHMRNRRSPKKHLHKVITRHRRRHRRHSKR